MSCSVCAGHSSYNCPCCSEELRMTECPECGGKGYIYHSFNIKTRELARTTEEAFQILPFDEDDAKDERKTFCQGDIDVCPVCGGEGEIPEDL